MNYECDKCDGGGRLFCTYVNSFGSTVHERVLCDKCGGRGKVNWIENIFGKEQKIIYINTVEELIQQFGVMSSYRFSGKGWYW